MPDSQLQNCPRPTCGSGQVTLVAVSKRGLPFYVECETCGCSGSYHATIAEAIAAWNKRGEEKQPVITRLIIERDELILKLQKRVRDLERDLEHMTGNARALLQLEAITAQNKRGNATNGYPISCPHNNDPDHCCECHQPRESTERGEEKTLRKIASIIPHQHCMSCNQMSEIAIDALNQFQSHTPSDTERELSEQLEFDRSLVADCLTRAKSAVSSRDWLTEGRGCYEWNDDRWHKEFGYAAEEFIAALAPLEKVAQDWSNCPVSAFDIATARIDLKKKATDSERELIELRRRLGLAKIRIHDWYGVALFNKQRSTRTVHCLFFEQLLAQLSAPMPNSSKPLGDFFKELTGKPTSDDVARLVDAATSIYRYIADEECLPKHCETKLEALRKALAPFKTAK